MKRKTGGESREVWLPGKALKERNTDRSLLLWQVEDGHGAARGHFTHRGQQQQLCFPGLLTLRAPQGRSVDSAARDRTVPLGGLQQAECSALQWNLPLENKARIKHLVALS